MGWQSWSAPPRDALQRPQRSAQSRSNGGTRQPGRRWRRRPADPGNFPPVDQAEVHRLLLAGIRNQYQRPAARNAEIIRLYAQSDRGDSRRMIEIGATREEVIEVDDRVA